MDSKKLVFTQTLRLLIGLAICLGAMFGIYGLLGRFSSAVLLGGLLGLVLATLNFFFMAVGTTLAADQAEKQDVKGGKVLLQTSMWIRHILIFVIVFAFKKSGWCDLLPMVLPLLFVRPVLTFGEFFCKKGDENG